VQVPLVGRDEPPLPLHVEKVLAVDFDVAAVDALERHQDP
jgi:hypothetical protein